MSKFLYRFRGWILGVAGVLLLLSPAAPLDHRLIPAAAIAFLLIILSIILRIQARRTIGNHTRGYSHAAETLVTTGLYARIRHPLYVSNTGISLAAILWHFGFSTNFIGGINSMYIAMAFVVFVEFFEVLLAKMEDRFLENKFGEQWRTWAGKTPAFLPRLNRHKDKTGKMPDRAIYSRTFGEAFLADRSSWFWIAVFFALLTLRKLF